MISKEETLKALGKAIKKLREEKGMTLDELAKRSGYDSASSRSTMQKIEAGKNDVPTSKLKAIALALDTAPSELIDMASPTEYRTITAEEKSILDLFNCLNELGREVAITRLHEMADLEKYTKK